jgi:hypothetical protein
MQRNAFSFLKTPKKMLAKVFWTFQKWTKINVQKRFAEKSLARNFKKKRVCYDMKGNSKPNHEKGGHKHLFVGPCVPGHSFFRHCTLEAF